MKSVGALTVTVAQLQECQQHLPEINPLKRRSKAIAARVLVAGAHFINLGSGIILGLLAWPARKSF